MPDKVTIYTLEARGNVLLESLAQQYVGHSNNLARRHTELEQGKGCRTTGIFGTGDILHAEEYPDRTFRRPPRTPDQGLDACQETGFDYR